MLSGSEDGRPDLAQARTPSAAASAAHVTCRVCLVVSEPFALEPPRLMGKTGKTRQARRQDPTLLAKFGDMGGAFLRGCGEIFTVVGGIFTVVGEIFTVVGEIFTASGGTYRPRRRRFRRSWRSTRRSRRVSRRFRRC